MLTAIEIKGFKSLKNLHVERLAPLSVIFGPNATGKSNFLDAIQVLSKLATEKTLSDALSEENVRGLTLEAFTFPRTGLRGLVKSDEAKFSIQADLATSALETAKRGVVYPDYRYRIGVEVDTRSGALSIFDEYLATLWQKGTVRNEPIALSVDGQSLHVKRTDKPARPNKESLHQNYSQVSDRRFTGRYYRPIQYVREELSSWRTYYLDPRTTMRASRSPQDVTDIGTYGENLAPFLFKVKRQNPKTFDQVRRTLSTIIPSISDLRVDLDEKRGVLDVEITQDGTPFSSRIISEGTLRVLALICIATNPWAPRLIAVEEPENGVHPRRIELIAQLLHSMVGRDDVRKQVLVTTHSTTFCGAILRLARNDNRVKLYRAVRSGPNTELHELDPLGPLFDDATLRAGLLLPEEEQIMDGLLRRGVLDS